MARFDCLVLGAGMVGISAALALQEKGRSVAMIDRRGPAEETSFGNAGLIQTEAVIPYGFPHDLALLFDVIRDRSAAARIDFRALGETGPWLWRYFLKSSRRELEKTAQALFPLVRNAFNAHAPWIAEAEASELVRKTGYLRLYRQARDLEQAIRAQDNVHRRFGIPYEALDPKALSEAEPHLTGGVAGAIHQTGPVSIADPGALGQAYAALFAARGGAFFTADAQLLDFRSGVWRLPGPDGPLEGSTAVLALGPWSADLLKRLRLRVPLAVKRGYHMHYGASGNAVLNHLVTDEDNGFVMCPMRRGIRITTGAEFARRDAPPSPVPVDRIEPIARALFPLADRLDPQPWIGSRPCLPDLLPVIGPVPGHDGLWADFGHQHLGFTLGPISGRLLAEMMTGEEPFTDPTPYRMDRF